MNMIRHDHYRSQVDCPLIRPHTSFHHGSAAPVGQNPSVIGAECQEMWFAVALEMREVAAVEGFRHEL